MNKKEVTIGVILSLLSVLISILFIYVGMTVVFEKNVPMWIMGFAVLTIFYGFIALVLVGWAWYGGGTKVTNIMKYLAYGYLVIFFLASLDVGSVSGLEISGIFFIAIALWVNWFAVSKVGSWRQNA